MEIFNGFPKEFIDYYVGLSMNNTLEKQNENLKGYKKHIIEPLNQLYETLLPVVCDISATLETKPVRCLSTPYTDRRFSPTTPLKEYMYLRFKQRDKIKDIPGLFFDMSVDGYSYGLRIYKQSSVGFDKLKQAVINEQEYFASILTDIADNGFNLVGEK